MRSRHTWTAALWAASLFFGGGAMAQAAGGEEAQPSTTVQQLSDAELGEVLDSIRSITKGDWREGYIAGLTQTSGMLHGSFVQGQVRAGTLTQETADKIKTEVDLAVEKLSANAKGDGSQFEGQAEGAKAMIASFKDIIAAMGDGGALTNEVADLLSQSADRLTGRANAAMYMSSAMRGITGKYLSVYGLANNRAVSDDQVKVIVSALEDLKAAFPDSAATIDSQIFKVSNLTIGRQAPNIKGVDTDEVPFELKEYLGRVVVIDFWGDW